MRRTMLKPVTPDHRPPEKPVNDCMPVHVHTDYIILALYSLAWTQPVSQESEGVCLVLPLVAQECYLFACTAWAISVVM